MTKYISKIFLWLTGWKISGNLPDIEKAVICMAPHTSNWDFVYSQIAYRSISKEKFHFLMKKEWFFFPFKYLFIHIGGIPVDRGNSHSLTDIIAEKIIQKKIKYIGLTPEGTRRLATEWKMGFYYIATKANVPIILTYLDYDKKICGVSDIFYPSGDEEKDLHKIKLFYNSITPKYPALFYKYDTTS